MDKRVAILTSFYEFDRAYSLVSVVEAQLRALVKFGYKPVLVTLDIFKDDDKVPEGVELRKTIPQTLLIDYSNNQPIAKTFMDDVKKIYEGMKKGLEGVDIVIEHDLIFQGWFLPFCVAIHRLAKEEKMKWFHWVHSAPSAKPDVGMPHSLRYKLPENSKLVYLNNKHVVNAAEMYGIYPKDVRVVYNPMDARLFLNLHPLIDKLIQKYDILNADFLNIYPLSTTRINAKQGDTVIEIMAHLKKMGHKVKLVFCNAHANDRREKQVIAEKLSFANERGLSANDVVFTSLEGKEYEKGVPKEVVSQLFMLSNLFIFPSNSENCSLVLLEAMLTKNLLVLNSNAWLPFREFAKENALYFDFGSFQHPSNTEDRERYLGDIAKIIVSEMKTNKALKASVDIKKHFNFEVIFKSQIEPLFYENGY